jgi:predicted aspartyl protease
MKTLLLNILLTAFLVSTASATQIIVPVTLTYHGRSVTALMSVDTGATVTTIGTELAGRLGIIRDSHHGGLAEMADGRAVRYHTAVMDITAGDMVQPDLDVNIMEYTGTRSVDGLLGMNFLQQMTLTIDWRNKRLYWSR